MLFKVSFFILAKAILSKENELFPSTNSGAII